MCITDNYLFHQSLGSDIDALDFVHTTDEDLEDKLSKATDDQLTNWLLTQGITLEEISTCADQGITLKALVEDQVSYGATFDIFD